MGFMKGQGATEYLVLLAVVLIVALVSIALLGFFPGIALDAKITQSASYWKGTRPFAILEYTVIGSSGAGTAVVQNVDASGTYSITKLQIGPQGYWSNSTTGVSFAPGEIKSLPLSGLTTGSAGSVYDFPVNISYTTPTGINMTFYASKNLVGKYT
ncbi:MAG: hypothetical protein N3E51_00070 [Candidatus Micrarchaeota archaeon]|nr:hypothetical protein [Candidatus Micrarchaeota archaeon]